MGGGPVTVAPDSGSDVTLSPDSVDAVTLNRLHVLAQKTTSVAVGNWTINLLPPTVAATKAWLLIKYTLKPS